MKFDFKINLNTVLILLAVAAFVIWQMVYIPDQITKREIELQSKLQASEKLRESYALIADTARKEKAMLQNLIEAALNKVSINNDTIEAIKKNNLISHEKKQAEIKAVLDKSDLEFMRAFSGAASNSDRSNK